MNEEHTLSGPDPAFVADATEPVSRLGPDGLQSGVVERLRAWAAHRAFMRPKGDPLGAADNTLILEAADLIDELEQLFAQRWEADQRAIAKWQEATGKTLVWPDHEDLVTWLLGRDWRTWITIETAPKSSRETPMLGWRGEAWSLFYWSEKWSDWADYWDGEPAPLYPVTHWMPLPDPPRTEDTPNPPCSLGES